MVVIGYGGQDKAINDRIVDWMESHLSHTMVVVNRAGERMVRQARGAIARGIPRWQERGRATMIHLSFEDVSAADYLSAVGLRAAPRAIRSSKRKAPP